MTFVIHLSDFKSQEEFEKFMTEMKDAYDRKPLFLPEPVADTRTEEEREADNERFVEDIMRHMEKAIDDD